MGNARHTARLRRLRGQVLRLFVDLNNSIGAVTDDGVRAHLQYAVLNRLGELLLGKLLLGARRPQVDALLAQRHRRQGEENFL